MDYNLDNDLYVIQYRRIDDDRCFRPLSDTILGINNVVDNVLIDDIRHQLSELFKKAGWDNSGVIECMFIPPCFLDSKQTFSKVVYHVKDSKDTSWLSIPKNLKLSLPIKNWFDA